MDVDAAQSRSAARARPVPFGQKLGYAAGGLVDGTALQSISVFLLFYVTSVCGLPGGLAGAAIAVGLLVDAVADPLIGSLSDNWRSRHGRRAPFMLASLLPLAGSVTLIFSLPLGLSHLTLFVWLCVLSITLRMSAAMFLLPHQALGAELSDRYAERSTLMALRWAFFMAGGIAGVAAGFGLFFAGPAGITDRARYTPFAATLSAIVLVGGLIAVRAALLTRAREHVPAAQPTTLAGLFRDVAEVFRSRSFRLLFFGAVFFFVGFSINGALGLHANAFFWHLTPAQTQAVTMGLFIGLLLGAPLGGPLLLRLEKRTVVIVGISGLLLCEAAPVTLRLLHMFPLEGGRLAGTLGAFALLMGMMTGSAGIAGLSAMADAADEHEDLFGTRREGLYYAGLAFANKAAAAIGTLAAGVILQAIAFPTDLVKQGGLAVHLPEQTIRMLGLAYGPGSALLSVVAILTYLPYRIDRAAHAEMIRRLSARREA